ncbi:MAG TPA: aminotransferase class III-fold pyridoxal phosphate-dependent enzyme [Gemmatimonadales bacterium]|nr:aminotransferase class III-fold pyridoxal phosphate-dependent enzyme [Gemmatimonadales bacterium]
MTSSPTVTFHRPVFGVARAAELARERYGLSGTLEELPSERDRNFRVRCSDGEFVLKVAHADDGPEILDLQHRALDWIARRAPELGMPRVIRSRSGQELERLTSEDGAEHLARVLSWVPGAPLAEVVPHSPELLRSLGGRLGALDRALQGFDHPAAHRNLKWSLEQAGWIRAHLQRVSDASRRALVTRHLERFEAELLPALAGLRRGVVHNDANDWNVIVAPGHPFERRVAAIVDLGDLLESVLIAELAIACAYAMQGKPDPIGAGMDVVAGYHAELPLEERELELLFPLICTRLAVSVVNSAEQRASFPAESYLTISERDAWATLERLEQVHPRLAHYSFRSAAGLEPCPAAPAIRSWLAGHAAAIGPLLTLDGPLQALDLSVGSPLIESPTEPEDLSRFTRKLFEHLAASGARVGVGHYDEARLLYSAPGYEAEGNQRDAPRTVHIGLDLFAPPGTRILAPLDGVVNAVRDNGMDRDYGPTLILRHEPPGAPVFYTLYGHLGREVLAELRTGARVVRGQPIATVGDLDVNGGWPPHLHFQLIADLLDRDGEFPGVARADRRAVWKSLSPCPNLVARLPQAVLAAPHRPGTDILAARRHHIGPSLSVAYRRPLTIVRGWKQYLYDEEGLRYLDGVNNVAHVGHCHPRVVRAIREQAAVLNTNTRYLHEHLVGFAERLTATLPAPLEVCYFVNSGSEANELAIRLARAATGRRGMVVVDVGYHGNTTTLIDVSPYKHDGPGGAGAPPWVCKIPLPDDYRGRFRRGDPDAGAGYAAAVADAIATLAERREAPAAFLAESILSCGGQLVLPDGFLREAYRRIREAGGVAIADEVQTGLGRVGSHFWAFATQGVVPDIVTLGKPLGNGHPLGAVVTTAAIAEAFANGMEYFNSFGGNPVSCAAGLAVLDVIAAEGLQQRAQELGMQLLDGLRGLVARHPIAGDARGLGLFAGLELVRRRDTLEPAGDEASYVANRMRERGFLVSTDGPFHNVLKLKPPLCIESADIARLLDALDHVLAEDYLRAAA